VPLLVILIVVLGLMLAVVLLMPVALVLRYRAGRARRQARSWVASVNIAALGFSVTLCLAAASAMSFWVPGALVYALGGLAAGVLLGAAGLALTRWEATRNRVHFTPNAWVVLFVTLVVSARLAYGVWRIWHAWHAGFDYDSRIVADGVRGSLAAGGILLGYYFTFWVGVLRQVRRHQRHGPPQSATLRWYQ
jgi:hypothetical protein